MEKLTDKIKVDVYQLFLFFFVHILVALYVREKRCAVIAKEINSK